MSKSYVILGKNGQLGRELQEVYPEALALDLGDVDITSEESLNKIDWSDKSLIINAAAWTAVDEAEKPENKEKVFAVNGKGPANLAKLAKENNLGLIHISSDYVFDGTKKNHSEDEAFAPLSVYGESKADGDQAIINSGLGDYYILRTSWVVGNGNNFIKTMYELAKKGIKPSVVDDQFGRLTFTSELVRAINYLLTIKAPYGVYNVTNSGEINSWCDIAKKVYELSGHNENDVAGVSTEEYYAGKEFIAPRPMFSDLDMSKIHETGFGSHDYEPIMEEYINDLKEGEK